MPHSRPTLTPKAVVDVVAAAFGPAQSQHVGLEVEWPVHALGDVSSRPTPAQMAHLAASVLPRGGRVTFEPGGQIELSSAPAASTRQALDAIRDDERALMALLRGAGLVAETLAVDQRRPPSRVLDLPRYASMEGFFDATGDAGRWMMCNTASVQVNLSHDPVDPYARWYTLHRVAPVLIAMFANSPGRDSTGRAWASLRQGIWGSIDPGRTAPVRTDIAPIPAWQEYAMSADVLYVAGEPGTCAGDAVGPGLPFGRWMASGHACGWPTVEDLRYHLTTLFPPVRPRGWLELRVLDALPARTREVAALTVAAACSTQAGRELERRLPATGGLWTVSARDGLHHPDLAAAARIVIDVVRDHLGAVSDDGRDDELLAEFADGLGEPRRPAPQEHPCSPTVIGAPLARAVDEQMVEANR